MACFPFFSVVDCGFPPPPKNGRYIGNQTTFRSSLRFKCDVGYDLKGIETRMCTSDKKWSGKEVTCVGKKMGCACACLQNPYLHWRHIFSNSFLFYIRLCSCWLWKAISTDERFHAGWRNHFPEQSGDCLRWGVYSPWISSSNLPSGQNVEWKYYFLWW